MIFFDGMKGFKVTNGTGYCDGCGEDERLTLILSQGSPIGFCFDCLKELEKDIQERIEFLNQSK